MNLDKTYFSSDEARNSFLTYNYNENIRMIIHYKEKLNKSNRSPFKIEEANIAAALDRNKEIIDYLNRNNIDHEINDEGYLKIKDLTR